MCILCYLYYFIVLNNRNIKPINAFISQIFNYCTICFVVYYFNSVFNEVYTFEFNSKFYEFLANITVRILQFLIILIIKFGVYVYEKYFKKNFFKND